MKRTLMLMLGAVVLLTWTLAAAEEAKPEVRMYQLVLAKHGPNWKSQATEEGMDIRVQVVEAVKKAAREGVIVAAGLVNDETDVEFILVLNVETKHEALALLEKAPNVANGVYAPEVYSWFAAGLPAPARE